MQKLALVTTTINIPSVLTHYRAIAPSRTKFFIAADEKTPLAAYEFCADIPNCEIYSPERQRELGYACSPLIPFNSIQRRNIATLEALKWGADVIVSIDDDNIPLGSLYFMDAEQQFAGTYTGLRANSPDSWFDVGRLLNPLASHRGMPHEKGMRPYFDSVTRVKIGVAAGICMGDPDISAVTRMAMGPEVHGISEILRSGVVVNPEIWTVFNSQNTAFCREIAPAFFMFPGLGRYDDIVASLFMQRLMRERGLHVHFGRPFVWQSRNPHNLVKDLTNELWGMEKLERIAYFLDRVTVPSGTVVEQMRAILSALDSVPNSYELLPPQTIEAAFAWLEDVEPIVNQSASNGEAQDD